MRSYVFFFLAVFQTCQADTNRDIKRPVIFDTGPCYKLQIESFSLTQKCIEDWEEKHGRDYNEVYFRKEMDIIEGLKRAPSTSHISNDTCITEYKLKQILKDFGLKEKNYSEDSVNQYQEGHYGNNVKDEEHKTLIDDSLIKLKNAYKTYNDAWILKYLKEIEYKKELERHNACKIDKNAC